MAVDVLAHQAAAQRDLLLGVGGQAGGALVELAAQSSISAIWPRAA
jgi:hypothetical protein